MQMLVTSLLWLSAIGCGLLAGLYFAFSTFIMTALSRVPAPAGIAAMQSINAVILNLWFLPLFLGTTALCVLLAAAAPFCWHPPVAPLYTVAGSLFYLAGLASW